MAESSSTAFKTELVADRVALAYPARACVSSTSPGSTTSACMNPRRH